jgi:hypothetical protein
MVEAGVTGACLSVGAEKANLLKKRRSKYDLTSGRKQGHCDELTGEAPQETLGVRDGPLSRRFPLLKCVTTMLFFITYRPFGRSACHFSA